MSDCERAGGYRACYWIRPDRQAWVVLTAPEDVHHSDEALTALALVVAHEVMGISEDSDDTHCITRAQLEAGLEIGDWS